MARTLGGELARRCERWTEMGWVGGRGRGRERDEERKGKWPKHAVARHYFTVLHIIFFFLRRLLIQAHFGGAQSGLGRV